MAIEHLFEANLTWSGAASGPTERYDSYSREFTLEIAGKPVLRGSAAAPFRGDAALHNPEDLLLAAVASCHLLSYLALCTRHRIAVVSYTDRCGALMAPKEGRMRFISATLRPRVLIRASDNADEVRQKAIQLHESAHHECFIANSVNFPIACEPEIAFSDR